MLAHPGRKANRIATQALDARRVRVFMIDERVTVINVAWLVGCKSLVPLLLLFLVLNHERESFGCAFNAIFQVTKQTFV